VFRSLATSSAVLAVALSLFARAAGDEPSAPAPAALVVAREGAERVELSLDALRKLPPETAVLGSHGETHEFAGARLDAVLRAAGVDFDAAGRRARVSTVVLAVARDGYEAAFSATELAGAAAPSRVLVAWSRDGAPLEAARGPFRLVVPSDPDAARGVYALERLEVIDLSQRAKTVVSPVQPKKE